MPDLMPAMDAGIYGALGLSLSVVIYLRLVWHKHSDPAAAGDDQLGVKTFCATLALTGVLMAGAGLTRLLGEILTWGAVKMALQVALPQVLVGAAVLGFVSQVYLPKTNHEQYPKAMRLTAGAIASIAGVVAVVSLAGVLTGVFTAEWTPIAKSLSSTVVAGGAAAGALVVLSRLSGINIDADDLAQGVASMAQNAAQQAAANIQQAVGEQEQAQQYQQPAPAAPQQQQQYQQPAPAPAPAQPQPGGFQPSMPPQQAPQPGGFQPAGQPPQPGGFQPSAPRPPGPPPPGGYKR